MTKPAEVGLSFDSGKHRYYWNGEPFPISVTGAIDVINKPALMAWAARLTAEYAVANHDVFRTMIDRGDRDGAVRWLKGEPFANRDKAAARGTLVHAHAEAIVQGLGTPADAAEEERPFVDSYVRWLEQVKPQFRLVEAMVANLEHDYAGTLDAMALIGGHLWLLDIKTSSGVYPTTALQLAAYANAEFIGMPGDPKKYRIPNPTRYGVIHVRPESTQLVEYQVTEFEWHAFLAALRLSRWVNGRGKSVMLEQERRAA